MSNKKIDREKKIERYLDAQKQKIDNYRDENTLIALSIGNRQIIY